MATAGHIIIRFGNTVVNFRRHWGGFIGTGTMLLQAIDEAPSHQERSDFHEGGYVVQLLAGVTGTMAMLKKAHNLTKLVNPVPSEFIMTDAVIGEGWNYGYEVSALLDETPEAITTKPVKWEIRVADHLDGYETAEDWLPNAKVFTPAELVQHLLGCLPADPYYKNNPEGLAEVKRALNKLSFPRP